MIKKYAPGIILVLAISVPAYITGRLFPVIGGPVAAIIIGMVLSQLIKNKSPFDAGLRFTSKKILQYAVVLLGFGLNLNVILSTGAQSLPIIVATISTSLIIAYIMCRVLKIPYKTATLVGVGSSICGGSAIAAAAPVIDADDDEVAQAISVIFFFNVIAALTFPALGSLLHFNTHSGNAFGVFAGTAINDTSSVTAAASTWDSMYHLGNATLDKAVTVKLTRTLAIIPITLGLAFFRTHKAKKDQTKTFDLKKIFPFFILFFLLASVFTTLATNFGISASFFLPIKECSKFFIVLAMAGIGLNSNIIKLIKTGGKPIIMGFFCWLGITMVSLLLQHFLGIW